MITATLARSKTQKIIDNTELINTLIKTADTEVSKAIQTGSFKTRFDIYVSNTDIKDAFVEKLKGLGYDVQESYIGGNLGNKYKIYISWEDKDDEPTD